MRYRMRRFRLECVFSGLASLVLGFVMPLALSGCGGGDGRPEMVKPAVAPAVAAKDSMNAFLKSSNHSKAKGTKRSFR
jgi:hypothetical protein